jgi:hypothetical protein
MADLKQNAAGLFSGLPTWAKGVIAVAVTGTLVFVGYKIYTKTFKSDEEKEAEKRKENELKFQKKEEKKEQKKVYPTYKESEYLAYADTIFNTFNGCGAGAYPPVERALMAMKNDLDVAKLITAYGTRQRTCLGVDTKGKDGLLVSITDEWDEIYKSSRNRVNNDWANKNIKYRV